MDLNRLTFLMYHQVLTTFLLEKQFLVFYTFSMVFVFCSGRHGADPHGAQRSLRADAASLVQPRRVPHRPPDGAQRRRSDRSLLHAALHRKIRQRRKINSLFGIDFLVAYDN